MTLLASPVSEIFFSYQGEGIYAGQPQVFVRFAGCNLRCRYCDTPSTQEIKTNHVRLGATQLLNQIRALAQKHFIGPLRVFPPMVSFTGGEPLLHAAMLRALLPALKKEKFLVYLETNGTLPGNYATVARWVDIVAMDIKLPSACGKNCWSAHSRFLSAARRKAFVKIIVTRGTRNSEIVRAAKLVAGISHKIPVILQPVTPSKVCPAPVHGQSGAWLAVAGSYLKDVRVVPQLHKLWHVR